MQGSKLDVEGMEGGRDVLCTQYLNLLIMHFGGIWVWAGAKWHGWSCHVPGLNPDHAMKVFTWDSNSREVGWDGLSTSISF